MTVTPIRSLEQRRQALKVANDIRMYRSRLKRDIHDGTIDARLVLLHPSDKVTTMKVWDLLLAMPGVGHTKANQVLRKAKVSPSKTIGGITGRQRDELLEQLEPSPYKQKKMAQAA